MFFFVILSSTIHLFYSISISYKYKLLAPRDNNGQQLRPFWLFKLKNGNLSQSCRKVMGKSTIEIQLYKKVMLYQVCTIKVNNAMQYVMNCSAVQFISVTWKSVVDSFLKFWVCPEEYLLVFGIIQFLKVMYLFLTLQVHPTLPSVFCETDSVFLRADT